MTTEEKIKQARNKYYREYRRKHPEKMKLYRDRYWAKKAAQEKTESGGAAEDDGTENTVHS